MNHARNLRKRRAARSKEKLLPRILWAAALAAIFACWSLKAFSPLARLWQLENTSQPGQLSVYNEAPRGGYYGLPVELGDYDGDGRTDMAIAPMAADGGNGSRHESGEVYVYPGNQHIEGAVDRASLGPAPPGLTLWGARAGDFLGTELYSADVTGDGIQDLLVGAQNYDGPDGTRNSSGGVFIVLGRRGLLDGSRTVDLSAPPPAAGIVTIVGANAGDRLGVWVEAGDLDGDGIADILMGADQNPSADPTGARYHNGSVVVLYGRRDFPPLVDLAQPPPDTSFILGADKEDHFGSCLHSRDLDRDGRAELIASASLNRLSASRNPQGQFPAHSTAGGDGPQNTRLECGEVRVFFGLPGGQRLPPLVDLARPLPPILAGRVTAIYGRSEGDVAGEELTTGDFNGDGFPDLVLGALTGKNLGGIVTGTAHVIYWKPGLEGLTIDLGAGLPGGIPPGVEVSMLSGLQKLDLLGDTLSAGDFDHDGFDDLAVGIPHQTLGEKLMAGAVAVVRGRAAPWPVAWEPQADSLPPELQVDYILGRNAEDLLSYSMEARDFDGDGYADIFPNAMRGDGGDNQRLDAGEAYLVSGFFLTGQQLALERVAPESGLASDSTPVAISGSGFTTDADTRVFAGGAELRTFRVATSHRIDAVMPPGAAAGRVDVRVENRYGSARLEGAFEYLPSGAFVRGDANLDGEVDISDPIFTLSGLFRGGPAPCPDACDADDSGKVDSTDALYTLRYLFQEGAPPPPPFPRPGEDPTADGLACR